MKRLVFIFLLFAAPAFARDVDPSQLASTVGHLLKEDHYSGRAFDEELSRRVLRNYMDDLDYDHLYFTQKDMTAVENAYAPGLGNEVLAGKLEPAWKIFDVYRRRVEERVAKVRAVLKETFDFHGNGTVETSRERSPWPKDDAEADAVWHARIEGELLDEKLSGHTLAAGEAVLERNCGETLRDLHEETRKEMTAAFLSSLARSYDPHSEYLTKEDLDDLDSDMRLSMVGIGAVLTAEDGFVKVVDLIPGSPAKAEGHLKVGDRITGVAQAQGAFIDVSGMRLDKVLDKIRGKAGTSVRLEVMPLHSTDPSQKRVVEIVRREIRLKDEEARAEIIEPSGDGGKARRLGWITIPSFYGEDQAGISKHPKSLTRDVRKLLKRLEAENIRGLVLDLRGDGGGLLAEAVSLSGLFLGKGPVVQVKNGDGSIEVARSNASAAYNGPLVVLTDRLTASAAELFSGALQDYGRAVILGGERTFGKGTVQAILELGDYLRGRGRNKDQAGALQLTIAKFYRVAGGSNQLQGIIPDIQLPSPEDLPYSGESAVKDPLPYDQITPAPFKKEETRLFLPELRSRSAARVAASPEFAYLEEDLQRDRKNLSLNQTSLNETARRAVMAEEHARAEERTAERLKRGAPPFKTYLLTLDNIRKPGLQVMPEDERKPGEEEEGKVDVVREESFQVLSDLVTLSQAAKTASITNIQINTRR